VTDFLTELREELLDGLDRYERAPWWRRTPRPAHVGPVARRIAAVAVAVAAIVVIVQLAGRGPDDERSTTPPVSRLEGFHASGFAVVGDNLWISQYNQSNLLRIDARTGKLRARIEVGGSPGGVVAGAGAIWVVDWEKGRLIKVDPATNRLVKTLTLGEVSNDIAFAGGAVWVTGDRGELLRVDPETVKVSKRVPLIASPSADSGLGPGVIAAGRTMWVAIGDGDIVELDARTGHILGHARGPALPVEHARRIAADDRALWISSPERHEVLRIDARSRRVTRYSLRGDPSTVAFVDGRLWVGTLHESGALTRVTVLDPADGHTIGTVPVPHPAVGIVASPTGGAWVTFGEDATVSPAAVRISGP
jgi:streptogramin lyase